jgi:multiple sugar transport system substrate-binding protein
VELIISASAVGDEGHLLARQLAAFEQANPGVRVQLRRTPDDATQRHQLYVQWLNARVGEPDVLQLDVVWTAEFAAAGWILPLEAYAPDTAAFIPAVLAADRWRGMLYAMPWFVDVGLLYRRTDLVPGAPSSLEELEDAARRATALVGGPRHGFVWQGARYEGLVTVFVEFLTAHGGRIMDDSGRVIVDEPAAVGALRAMRRHIDTGLTPRAVLGWHEEETRFAFQNGEAAFMRNWPYAYPLLADSGRSEVAGNVAVSPLPATREGRAAAALGGAQLAINAYSSNPDDAWRLVEYLTAPERMIERAAALGQFPPRIALYDDDRLAAALPIPLHQVRDAVRAAVARPATPVWTQLSEILQVHVHRALSGQSDPAEALDEAATQMNAVLEQTGIRTFDAAAMP